MPGAGRRAQVGGPKAAVEVSQRRVTRERVRGRLQVAEAPDRAVRRPVGRSLRLQTSSTAVSLGQPGRMRASW